MKTREHAGKVLALYTEERHGPMVGLLNQDLKTFSLTWMALSTWMLGYPEQAVKISDAALAHARRLGHPFNLSWSLTYGALLFEHVGEPEELLKRVEEGERVARENSLLFVTEVLVRLQFGAALIRKGEFTAGVASLKAGRAIWENGGGRLAIHSKSALAEGMAQLGDLDGALDLIGEIIAQIERPGWEERHYYAETLRIKGWVLSLKGDLEGAERNYLASLDWARQQQAKSWELRTSTSYARLMRDQGRPREAHDLLAPVYGWFTEGFDTLDLKEARSLLEQLKS
jgi:predicted ATPase